MPNQHNIESPATLITSGRSGTSLLAAVFQQHADVQFVGETANLIFYTYEALDSSNSIIPSLFEGETWVPNDERAGRVVREAFLTSFPDSRRFWFQKPIGIPMPLATRFNEKEWSEAAEWYWKVLGRSFPKGKFFTVLRHPCDVVLSAKAYWGYDEATSWWSVGFMAYLLAHPASLIQHVISYDELVQHPEQQVRDLFMFLDIPFRNEVLNAFSQRHASTKERSGLNTKVTTRRDEWSQLNPALAKPLYFNSTVELFEKHGIELALPDHFVQHFHAPEMESAAAPSGETPTQANGEAHLWETIADLNHQIGKLHRSYAEKQQEREREIYETWTNQRAWISQLERSRQWLDEQRLHWQAEAQRLQQIVGRQQQRVAALEARVGTAEALSLKRGLRSRLRSGGLRASVRRRLRSLYFTVLHLTPAPFVPLLTRTKTVMLQRVKWLADSRPALYRRHD
jgi:hypothetical protein